MYQVLARKYRPRNFNELVGQNHVSRALTSALERGRLHHAYLFTGTRGVGKTTIARILAKCLNCETGVTSTPCEVCPTCVSVNEGRFIDLIEIDAASRTKVEDTRELLDNVPYAPTQGRFKVYLIDEVHMLSTHSFNALLKTLEEPPEHVKFLFATTDPQKLPITVISRCLQFTLRPLAVDEITTHLTEILVKESIQAEQDAIWQIAESAQGSLRDALSLTDQAIAYGQGAIAHQDVKEMLGLIDRSIIYDLLLAIHQNQATRVSALLLQFRQQALDVSLVLDQLISTLHELALLQYLPDLALKYSAEINKKIVQLSKVIQAADLQLYYQIGCKGRADLQLAVTQEQGFEMCVLRLLAFRPLQPNEVVESISSHTQPIFQTDSGVQSAIDEPVSDVSVMVNQDDPHHFMDDVPAHSTETESMPAVEITTQTMVFDATAVGLLALDDDETEQYMHQTVTDESSDDFLFLAIEDTPALTAESKVESDQVLDHAVLNVVDTTPIHDELRSVEQVNDLLADAQHLDHQFEMIEEMPVASPMPSNNAQLPQDILRLADIELSGEWTIEKWEYWFRSSDLSPALQELAQQGLMQGVINGSSIFQISPQYEQLLHSLQDHLEQALKDRWPSTQFSVNYQVVDGDTPYHLQVDRKQRAQQRAIALLQDEPGVKSLLENFNGELQNVQLK